MRRYSPAALKRVTEPWEEYVGYPYDDLVPKGQLSQVQDRFRKNQAPKTRSSLVAIGVDTDADAAASPGEISADPDEFDGLFLLKNLVVHAEQIPVRRNLR